MLITMQTLDSIQEGKTVANGRYDVVVTSAKEGVAKTSGKPQILVTLAFTDPEYLNSDPIFHYISLPAEDDEPRAKTFKYLLLKRFLRVMKYTPRPGSTELNTEILCEDLQGRTANVEVFTSNPDDQGRTSIKLNLPKLPEEGKISSPPARKR